MYTPYNDSLGLRILSFSITRACGPFMLIAYMMENGQTFVL